MKCKNPRKTATSSDIPRNRLLTILDIRTPTKQSMSHQKILPIRDLRHVITCPHIELPTHRLKQPATIEDDERNWKPARKSIPSVYLYLFVEQKIYVLRYVTEVNLHKKI